MSVATFYLLSKYIYCTEDILEIYKQTKIGGGGGNTEVTTSLGLYHLIQKAKK